MIEEEAVTCVEQGDSLHIVSIKGEVEEVEILFHTTLVHCLRDDYHVALQQPAQCHLSGGLAIFLGSGAEVRG